MDSIQRYAFPHNLCLQENKMEQTQNYANLALREAVAVFFCSGPYRVAEKHPENKYPWSRLPLRYPFYDAAD